MHIEFIYYVNGELTIFLTPNRYLPLPWLPSIPKKYNQSCVDPHVSATLREISENGSALLSPDVMWARTALSSVACARTLMR